MSVPHILELELSSICNARCPFCIHGYSGGISYQVGHMPAQQAFQIIEQAAAAGVDFLYPQWIGESMLNPGYLEVIRYARMHDLHVIVGTNGELLTVGMSYNLLNAEVDKILLSINDCDPQCYEEQMMPGLRFHRVMENLNVLRELRDDMNADTQIIIRCLLTQENENRCQRIIEFFTPLCDKLQLRHERAIPGCYGRDNIPRMGCRGDIYRRMVVGWNSVVYLCCMDITREYPIGDLSEQNLLEVWNGKRRADYLSRRSSLTICRDYCPEN